MTLQLVAIGLTALSCFAVAWRWRHAARTWGAIDRLGTLVLVPGFFTAWSLVVRSIAAAPTIDWNGARLAPTFALVHGYALYYPATSGPILSTIYGPLAAFAFLPAVLFPTPTSAVLCAATLTVAFVIVPLLVIGWWTRPRTPDGEVLVLACALGACALLARFRGGRMWLTTVHPDAPALACGLLACAALWSRDPDRPPAPARLGAAAVLALASVAMKQVSAPLPAALAVFVWLAWGWTACLRYLGALVAAGTVLALALLIGCDVRAMVFNTVTIVTRQPWIRPGASGLAVASLLLLRAAAEPSATLGVAAIADVSAGRRGGGWRAWLRRRPWTLPAIAAICLYPAGVLGFLKIGGDQNSFYGFYFLVAAVNAALAWNAATLSRPSARAAFRIGCYLYCAVNVGLAWTGGEHMLRDRIGPPSVNGNQQAWEFMRRHPGEAYFPWYPLAGLMAEGRLYHFEYGIVDRYLAGFDPTREHVMAALPPRMHMIVSGHRTWMLRYFPDYTRETTDPELPGWKVFSRPPDAASAP